MSQDFIVNDGQPLGAISSLTRITAHQASTVSESTIGSIQGILNFQVSWIKELSSLITNLIEVTQVNFLNKMKRLVEENSRENIRGAERSIMTANLKNFIQVVDGLIYIAVTWNNFYHQTCIDNSDHPRWNSGWDSGPISGINNFSMFVQ